MKRRRKGLKKKNSRNILPIGVILVIMLAIVGIHSHNLWRTQTDLKAEREQLEQQLADEQARTEELKELRKYVQTDSYAEEVAQDKLGLVHEGEIVFEIQR